MDSTTTLDLGELASAAIGRGELTEASSLIIHDPDDPTATRLWGRLLLAQGMHSDAVQAMRHATELDPLRAEVHLELAQTLMHHASTQSADHRDDTWVDARDAARRALRLDPELQGAYRLLDLIAERRLVDSLQAAVRPELAVPPARSALRLLPQSSVSLANTQAFAVAAFVMAAGVFAIQILELLF